MYASPYNQTLILNYSIAMKASDETLLNKARQTGEQLGLTYWGALTPIQAWELLQTNTDAVLVDVRTDAELDWVGCISFSEDRWFHIEWSTYPEGGKNPEFLQQLQSRVDKEQPLLFLCRSGARSHNAATLAEKHGYVRAINVLEGFEGDKDDAHRRSSVNGWRFHKLPWEQH